MKKLNIEGILGAIYLILPMENVKPAVDKGRYVFYNNSVIPTIAGYQRRIGTGRRTPRESKRVIK